MEESQQEKSLKEQIRNKVVELKSINGKYEDMMKDLDYYEKKSDELRGEIEMLLLMHDEIKE